MESRPFHHQAMRPWSQLTPQYRERIDSNDSLLLSVTHVKMRRRVVVIEHGNDYTEKPADFGH